MKLLMVIIQVSPLNTSPQKWLHIALECDSEYSKFQSYKETDLHLIFFFLSFFAISWAAPVAYGGFQARGRIRAVATRLHQSHSNMGSKPCLQPIPQLTATPDP